MTGFRQFAIRSSLSYQGGRVVLRVCVLGEQSITDERAASLRIRSSRTVALIRFLTAHPRSPQTRQRIAGLFWPESADGQALTNLRRELHNLRQIMGDEESLVVSPRDLCWRDSPTCRVDLRLDRKSVV